MENRITLLEKEDMNVYISRNILNLDLKKGWKSYSGKQMCDPVWVIS